MSVDFLQTPLDPPSQPTASHGDRDRQRRGFGSGHWSVLAGVLVIAVSMISRTALQFIASESSTAPMLTHTVTRGDLDVTVTEQGTLESSNNTEIKCKVRGYSTVTWVIPAGTVVEPGDELVRLDTKVIEEEFSLTKTNTYIAKATLEQSKANVAKAKIAIDAYKEGRFRSQLQALEKELQAKQRNLRTARKMLERSEELFKQGYVTELEVDSNAFTVTQAQLELDVKQTEIKVLNEYTREMELETLQGNLTASQSKLAADEAGLAMEIKRGDRAKEELTACVITADTGGLVIYPSAAAWKRTPDITEGASVRKDQVLLLMPDLTQMQVKVGIHESIVERVRPGLPARVVLPDRTLEAEVSSVASVTRPAGWWTGNVVKYDTVIELPPDEGLKPGMSAEVEVLLATHRDVLTVPVAAVLSIDDGDFCWVKTAAGLQKRRLHLGDSNDVFMVVQQGLRAGDEVILNPIAVVDEAATIAAKSGAGAEVDEREEAEAVVDEGELSGADAETHSESSSESSSDSSSDRGPAKTLDTVGEAAERETDV